MRVFAILIACVFCAPALANDLAGMDNAARCELLASNAGHGATQFLRGAPRELQYIREATLKEMIEHFGGVGHDKIYVLDDAGYTAEERAFLEQSTLFGYDSIATWHAAHADRQPELAEWVSHIRTACLNGELTMSPIAQWGPTAAGPDAQDSTRQ